MDKIEYGLRYEQRYVDNIWRVHNSVNFSTRDEAREAATIILNRVTYTSIRNLTLMEYRESEIETL